MLTLAPKFATAEAARMTWLWVTLLGTAAALSGAVAYQNWPRIQSLWHKPPVSQRAEPDGERLLMRSQDTGTRAVGL
jgi:hypothetical protein